MILSIDMVCADAKSVWSWRKIIESSAVQSFYEDSRA